MAGKRKGRCYYCGDGATSREHAPPRAMFEGFACDSITAPSCDQHNTQRSGDDQAIIALMLVSIWNTQASDWTSSGDVEPEVVTALKNAPPSFEYAKRRTTSAPLLDGSPKGFEDMPDVGYLQPSVSIWRWIRQLTAALVWDARRRFIEGIEWSQASAWSPGWIASPEASPIPLDGVVARLEAAKRVEASLERLKWQPGWSATPRGYPPVIYHFDLHFEEWGAIFRHSFYNRYSFYVAFEADRRILLGLRMKALGHALSLKAQPAPQDPTLPSDADTAGPNLGASHKD